VPQIGGQKIEPFGMPGKKAFDLVHNVMPFVWGAGGAELNDDATRSAINTPEAQQGVEFFADLVADGLSDRSMLERDGTQVENQFKGGRLGVWIGGVWVLPSAARKDDDNWVDAARRNVAVAPMPKGPSGEAFTFVGGSNLMLFKNSKHKEAAWALIEYLSQDRVQSDYAALMGMFPSRLEAQKARAQESPQQAAFFEAIQAGRSYAAIPQWGQIENAYKTRFGTILDMAAGQGGDYSPAAIRRQLDDAAAEADNLLAQSAG
jgi:multiple sugar transport system substrate-binding protein